MLRPAVLSFLRSLSICAMFDEFKHGVVVTERRYYEEMKHTYPYSHWRLYDTRSEYSRKL